MAVSKRLRYEILRRDGFTCRYCGAKPPDAQLTADHVVPVALGGADDPSNLVAACDACNGGKTSSSPDAPLVADVGEDALRWSRALTEAAAKMRADIDGLRKIHEQFDEWWGCWTYGGDKETPLPRPDGWRSSIDSFLAAGLPLDVLKWCLDKAMASKVAPEGTWKYMCGIAWRKVNELQGAASALAAARPRPVDEAEREEDDPSQRRGRADLAREMLGDLDREEISRLHAEARENWQARTEDELDIAAAQISWSETMISLSWLGSSTCDLLLAIPDQVIQDSIRKARIRLYDDEGAGFSRADFAQKVVSVAAREYEERAALSYLATLPPEERIEWLSYANSHFQHSLFPIISAAQCARSINAGHGPYRNMCIAPGEHIPFCPGRAAYWVRFNELQCCREKPEEDHKGHRFCEKHHEKAVAGGQRHNGEPVTVMSSSPADAEDMAVPF